MDEELDVFSARFNAAKALRSDHVALPTDTYPLDTLWKCRCLLPQDDPNYKPLNLSRRRNGDAAKDSTSAATAVSTSKSSEKKPANQLVELVESFVSGPLAMLRNCYNDKAKVTVYTKTAVSMRGTCEGFIKVFDKHLNMVLFDVNEKYKTNEFIEIQCKSSQTTYNSDIMSLNDRTESIVYTGGDNADFKTNLIRFFVRYNESKIATADKVIAKYNEKRKELWLFLHEKYGIKKELLHYVNKFNPKLLPNIDDILFDHRSKELELLSFLNFKYNDNQRVWVKKQSTKYKGKSFYYNTITKESVWTRPPLARFKVIQKQVERSRYLKQVLIRGDNIALVVRKPLN